MSPSSPEGFVGPPSGSNATVQRCADGLTVTIPPKGLRGLHFALFWAIGWCVLAAAFMAAIYMGIARGEPIFGQGVGVLLSWLFPPLFLLIGPAVIVLVLRLARRRAAFAVCGDRLCAVYVGLFGTRRGEWPCTQVAEIRAGQSGVTQNDQPQWNLQILLKSGARFTLLLGRRRAELEWLAEVLRLAVWAGSDPHERAQPPVATVAKAEPAEETPVATGAAETGLPLQTVDCGPGPKRPSGRPQWHWFAMPAAGAIGGALFLCLVSLPLFYAMIIVGAVLHWVGWAAHWPSLYWWAAVGAAIGGVGEWLALWREKRWMGRLWAVAQALGLDYENDVARNDLGEFAKMRLFEKWRGAEHRMSGRYANLPVQLLDYTCVDRETERKCTQTVLLLKRPGDGIPPFALRTRDWKRRLLHRLGTMGIIVLPEEDWPDVQPQLVMQFNRRYFFDKGPSRLAKKMAELLGPAEEPPPAPRVADNATLRRLFTAEVIRYLVEHAGWCLESDGIHFAAWRRGKVVRAADRRPFLDDALAVHNILARSAESLGAASNLPREK